jgi:hypothetical protein
MATKRKRKRARKSRKRKHSRKGGTISVHMLKKKLSTIARIAKHGKRRRKRAK